MNMDRAKHSLCTGCNICVHNAFELHRCNTQYPSGAVSNSSETQYSALTSQWVDFLSDHSHLNTSCDARLQALAVRCRSFGTMQQWRTRQALVRTVFDGIEGDVHCCDTQQLIR